MTLKEKQEYLKFTEMHYKIWSCIERGMKTAAIAREVGRSHSRVSQIIEKLTRRINAHAEAYHRQQQKNGDQRSNT